MPALVASSRRSGALFAYLIHVPQKSNPVKKMKPQNLLCKVILISVQVFCLPAYSYGQACYTLEDILAISAEKSNQIKLIQNSVLSDKQQVSIYRAGAFPKIDFATSIGYANQTQRGNQLSMTTDIVNIFERIDGLLFNWSVSLQQPLFEFGKVINSFHLATLSKKIIAQNTALQRDRYFLQVVEQFTRGYISQFDYRIAEQTLARTKKLLEGAQLNFDYAKTSKRELLRTQSSFEGSSANFIQAKTNRLISIQKLNVLIGLPDSIDYILQLDTSCTLFPIPDTAKVNNYEINLKELETQVNKKLRKNARADLLPSLSAFASIYNEFFTVDTTGLTGIYLAYLEENPLPPGAPAVLFPENPSATEFFNPDFFNYSLGVQLNWNVFDGTRSWAQYKQAKLKEERSRIELDQLKRETENSINEVRGQISSLDNSILAYGFQFQASQKALEQADLDLQNGFIDAVTYLDIDREYRDAARQLDEAKLQRVLLRAQLRLLMGLPLYETQ